MRRRRHLTPLELDWARQAVHQLCLANHLKPGDETYLSAGLQAFWEVYTARPSVSGQDFWPCAFRKMEEAILAEKRENDRWTYARSLDAPVAPDREVTYFDLLRARQGDFTNSVALFDYLDRLPPEQSRLARRLLAQDTLEEARSALGWDTPAALPCAGAAAGRTDPLPDGVSRRIRGQLNRKQHSVAATGQGGSRLGCTEFWVFL